jgi:hypothetical protein
MFDQYYNHQNVYDRLKNLMDADHPNHRAAESSCQDMDHLSLSAAQKCHQQFDTEYSRHIANHQAKVHCLETIMSWKHNGIDSSKQIQQLHAQAVNDFLIPITHKECANLL